MKITVVIPTYNRFDKLILTLNSLNNQTFQDFNVIVMDDGSIDDTVKKCEQIKTKFNYSLTIYTQVNAGASKAINNAVSKIKDGLIILIDDDIILANNCIEMHQNHHKTFPDSLLSGPAYVDKKTASTDIEKYKIYMEDQWRKITNTGENAKEISFDNFAITTANMSLTKNTFQKIGSFDEKLRDGYDFEFGLRALEKNIKLYFDSTIEAIHNDKITLRYYAKRQKCYIESKKIIFANNPKYNNKNNERKLPILKKIVYAILSLNFVVNFIENNKLFLFLPKDIRYKFYGSTIAALSQ